MNNTLSEKARSRQLYPLLYGGLALVGVCQILLFAYGAINKLQAPPVIKIVEKEVPKFITIKAPREQINTKNALTELPDLPPLPKGFTSERASAPLDDKTTFKFDPPIKDPLAEKLLKEAKTARIAGDMRLVALKLEEAKKVSPKSPHVTFLYGDMYEAMGIFDKASESYEKVFSYGLNIAGPLYRISAQKLKDGFGIKKDQTQILAIGNINQFRDKTIETGESITLNIPILSSPEEYIDPSQVTLSVRIFDRINQQIVPCLPSNRASCKWKDSKVNWEKNGMEYLVASYYLPSVPSSDDTGIGPRTYYGYSIELSYRGELVDQAAWPRILAKKTEIYSSDDFNFPFDGSDVEVNFGSLLPPPLKE